MYKVIDATLFKEMIHYGARHLALNQELINSLNVFPVPDGDTGTNMTLTMSSAVNEVDSVEELTLEAVAIAFAKGALKGARGNSGVILSQIIKGICEILKELKEFNPKDFSKALRRGTEIAYSAVTKPKEGTILTVIRVIAEGSGKASIMADFTEYMSRLCKKGDDILAKTQEMLPVLKKAGTVDAGGMGLLVIFKGFLSCLRGEDLPELPEEGSAPVEEQALMTPRYELIGDIEFGYCTEFFVINLNKKTTLADIDKFRDKLIAIGDSVLAIGDLEMVKVHVHTNNPNLALGYALQLGEIDRIKIENMREQNRQLIKKNAPKEHSPIAVISISSGDGIKSIAEELGAAIIIDGGQTMNPSVDDIVNSIVKANADSVIILPNNKNIILAAQQAKELAECEVLIVPTVNVMQGMRALMAYNPLLSASENVQNMQEGYADLVCMEVTYAVKDTNVDDVEIHEGNIIGIGGKHIRTSGDDKNQVLLQLIEIMGGDDRYSMSIYYGNNTTEEEAQQAVEMINQRFPDMEVVCLRGGQQHYFYFLSME